MNKKDLKVSTFLAYKNITKSKATFFVIVAVMAMSFLSISFFAAIIEGIGYEFEQGVINGQTGHLMIEPKEDQKFIENSHNKVQNIQKIPGVLGATRRLDANTVVNYKNIDIGAPTLFIEPINENKVSNLKESVIEGAFLTENDYDSIIIGADLVKSYAEKDDTSQRLNVQIGDKIRISYKNGVIKEYKIKGIYKTGSRNNDNMLLLNFDEYKKIFNTSDDYATKILVKLNKRGLEEEYRLKLIDLGISEKINPWNTQLGPIKQFVGSLQKTNMITGLIGILTAFATIYIVIFINVLNKRKQIGILKAIGIKKEIILGSYVMQSFAYGISGVILGNILMQGLLFFFRLNPITMPMGNVVPILTSERIIITSIILVTASILAGLFPSKKAAERNILDAIFGG